jgi:LPXTG-site transpeptidase (sortase) family protein
VAIVVLAAAVVVLAAFGGSEGAGDQVVIETATPTAAPPTPSVEQVLQYFAAIMPTATPAPAASGGGGGGGGGNYVPRGGSGPGAIRGTDMSLSIPSIGVSASVYSRSMGTNGQMGNPAGAWDVIWYDFSANYPGLGGRPGEPGANAVFAGHVDYIRVGPAVFYSIKNLGPGSIVTVNTGQGPVSYSVQWSAWAGANEDFTKYVSRTGQDVITLVTCIGGFSAGHYSNRLVVRGVRI